MDKRFKRIYRVEWIIVIGLLLVMTLGRSIWYDESLSIQMAQQSFTDIVRYTAGDVHPPLYYFILKVVVSVLGTNFFSYRIVSVIPYIGMLFMIGQFLKKQYGYKESCIGVLLVVGAPRLLTYAVEIRMYSWCMCFVLASFLQAYDIYGEWKETGSIKKRKWIIFSVINVLAAYLHYFAGAAVVLISLGLIFLLLLERKNVRGLLLEWLGSTMLTFVLYLPWLMVFFRQLSNVREDYWIAGFRIHDLKRYAEMVLGTSGEMQLLVAIFLALAIYVAVYFWKGEKKDVFILYGIVVFVGFICLGIGLSVLITPVFVPRYISIVLPIFWLVFCVAMFQWKIQLKYLIVGVFACALFTINYSEVFEIKTSDDNFSAYYFLEEKMEEDDVILTSSSHVLGEMTVYFPNRQICILEKALAKEAFQCWDDIAGVKYLEEYSEIGGILKEHKDGWLLLYEDDFDTEKCLKECGYELEYQGEYTLGYDGGHLQAAVYRISL